MVLASMIIACLAAAPAGRAQPGRAGFAANRLSRCATGLVYCTGPHRSCPQVPIAGVAGNVAEIDLYGRPLPRCRPSIMQLRRVSVRLPEGKWGHVGQWKCRWRDQGIVCIRQEQTLWATNPGD